MAGSVTTRAYREAASRGSSRVAVWQHDVLGEVSPEQGGVWDEFGNPVDTTGDWPNLKAADGYFTEWYEWVSSYPQSKIAD